jgi:hypothetical protein
MKDFISNLLYEIDNVTKNKMNKQLSFRDFLHSLDTKRILEYDALVSSVIEENTKDPKKTSNVLTFYLLIIQKIEKPNVETIELDPQEKWVKLLSCFIGAEMCYREGLIKSYEGLLSDKSLTFEACNSYEPLLALN